MTRVPEWVDAEHSVLTGEDAPPRPEPSSLHEFDAWMKEHDPSLEIGDAFIVPTPDDARAGNAPASVVEYVTAVAAYRLDERAWWDRQPLIAWEHAWTMFGQRVLLPPNREITWNDARGCGRQRLRVRDATAAAMKAAPNAEAQRAIADAVHAWWRAREQADQALAETLGAAKDSEQ